MRWLVSGKDSFVDTTVIVNIIASFAYFFYLAAERTLNVPCGQSILLIEDYDTMFDSLLALFTDFVIKSIKKGGAFAADQQNKTAEQCDCKLLAIVPESQIVGIWATS